MYKEYFLSHLWNSLDAKSKRSMSWTRQLCPRLDRQEHPVPAYVESSIKLTGIVKCTDTLCTGILMAACYCICYAAWTAGVALGSCHRESSTWLKLVQRCYCRVLAFSRFGTCKRLHTLGNTAGEHDFNKKHRENITFLRTSVRCEFSYVSYPLKHSWISWAEAGEIKLTTLTTAKAKNKKNKNKKDNKWQQYDIKIKT